MGENPGCTGRCLCGAVRYKLESAPFDAGYCHCRICQLASGAPVMAFATIPRSDYVITSGTPEAATLIRIWRALVLQRLWYAACDLG
jgi:hypothetical protein